MLTDWLALAWAPFHDYHFMRRALLAVCALALGSAPLGVFLSLRRMSLLGDALSHAILPGVAIAFLLFGLSLPALTLGGFLAGLVIVVATAWSTRRTGLREDSTFAAGYLVALAAGVLLIAWRGSDVDLLHILFGNVLGVTPGGALLVTAVATGTVLLLTLGYRALLLEHFDPGFLDLATGRAAWVQVGFLLLVVANLVAAFQVLGTLMAVGLMILPAISARLWHALLPAQLCHSVVQALIAGYLGLLLSFYLDLPSGPVIVLCAGAFYVVSLLVAPYGVRRRGRSHG